MNAFSSESTWIGTAIEQLAWVLVHSVWQFAIIGLVAALLMPAAASASPNARYGLLLGLLGLACITPIATWSALPRPVADVSQSIEIVADATPSNDLLRQSDAVLSPSWQLQRVATPDVQPDPSVSDSPPRRDFTTLIESVSQILDPHLRTIVIAWCLGVVVCSLRPLVGWRMVRRLRSVGTSVPSQEVISLFNRLSNRLQVKRPVELLESTVAKSPIMIGCLRPAVLLPVSFVANIPASQLEAILAHELAHVRRHDFAVNLLQTLLETLLFYHPAVWWLSRRIRIEREHCCDDLAVAMLNNRGDYGRALIAVERLRSETPSLAIGASDGSLLARIRRLAGADASSDHRFASRMPLLVLAFVSLSLSLLVLFTLRASADDESDKPTSFVAEVSDKIEVELVAVGYHPSTGNVAFDQTPAAGKTWWKPNGEPLLEPPALPDSGFSVGANAEENSRSREFLLKIRGLPQNHRVRTEYGTPSASGSSYLNGLWIGYHGAGPFKSTTTKIRLGITTEPYGPWVSFDTEGVKSGATELSRLLRSLYEKVAVREVESDETSTTLLVDNESYHVLYDVADFELYAVDRDGKQHRRSSESVPAFGDVRELTFKLPKSDVARFEYRMRPFTTWVTFDDVSLQPGQSSDVKISAETTGDASEVSNETAALGEFGPVSHGVRCRLVALPTGVDDDEPDFQRPVSNFARSSDMTFGVELKNVSDEPIVLPGVRYGDGYADEVRGVLRTEMLAPCWFDFDFISLDGNTISRPHRELFEGWFLADGASTHKLLPGQSLRLVLRPNKFMHPLDHDLPPGKYSVRVRYQGPDESLRQRVGEHWPDKPILSAWNHQVESVPIEFSIAGSAKASTELHDHSNADPSTSPGVPVGTSIGVNIHVRNVSDRDITFISETGRQGDQALVTDAQGNKIEVRETFMSGWPIDVEWRLRPGEVAELSVLAPAINSIKKPGRYDVRYKIRFDSRIQRDDKGNVIFPRPGDYDSELETGVTPLHLQASSDSASNKPEFE